MSMRCPTLAELPPPPPGKTGWPWTEESPQLPKTMPDGSLWSRVSVVTPSYNQAQFIEETIRSVLLQGYPNLEYIIIDGGSTDDSVEIIRKYEPWLTYWVSEPDGGQSEAINKGWSRSRGDMVAWLNSDDIYLPDTINQVMHTLSECPNAVLVYGICQTTSESGEVKGSFGKSQTLEELLIEGNKIPQPGSFMSRIALENIGWLDTRLHYVMDYELWVRLAQVGPLGYIPKVLARLRLHGESKTVSQTIAMLQEWRDVLDSRSYICSILSEAELIETHRRQQVRIALEWIFLGKEMEALENLNEALGDKVWPYGSADRLAEYMFSYAGLVGHTMTEPRLDCLLRVVTNLQWKGAARSLHAHLISLIHMKAIFRNGGEADRAAIRRHLGLALRHNPRWLTNRGVLSTAAEVFLGPRLTNWLRQGVRKI